VLLAAALASGLATAAPRGAEVAGAPAGLSRAFSRRVALVVGINDYGTDPSIADLRYAEKDAQDIAAVLSEPRFGDFDEAILLTGTVTKAAFWRALAEATEGLGAQDTFILYFAGHGTLELTASGTALYLMPSDGRIDDPARSGISLEAVEDAVAALPARQRVVMVDACHSITADARSSVSDETRAQLARLRGTAPSPAPRDVSTSEVFLYAAAHNQPAQEDSDLKNGVYTHFLLRALQGEADLNGDSLVEVMELHNWVSERTERHTSGQQIPQVQARTVGREAIFLSGDALDRVRAEELYRRRLLRLGGTAPGVSRGLTVDPGRTSWGLHGLQVGYEYRLTSAQHRAQAEALGEALVPHRAEVGYALRQRPGSGALRPLLIEEFAVTGLTTSPEVRLSALAGASLQKRLSLAAGARWSPDVGLRPAAVLGFSPTAGGRVDLPMWLTFDAGDDAYWSMGLVVGAGRTLR
jgi:hypothetical protein